MAITEAEITALAESIVHGAQERYVEALTNVLIDDLASGMLTGRGETALATLAQTNRVHLQTALMAHRDAIANEIEQLVTQALITADKRDTASLRAYYGDAITIPAAGYTMRASELAHQTAVGLAQVITRQNIEMSTHAERLWYETAGRAITAYNEGLKPLSRIMAEGVTALTASGIETIDYKSGISSQTDVAIRRHVVSQVSQAGGRMTLARLQSCGHELVITSAHYGARPSHAEWQGKPCLISGPGTVDGVHYPGLTELTGYGTVGGLKGVNCRHSIGPYYPGITKLTDLDFPKESAHFGQTSEQYFDATQRQRELERRVRKTKREVAALERAGLSFESPTYVQKRLLLGNQQAALRTHCEEKHLARQYAREKAYGVSAQPRALRVNPNIKTRNKKKLASGKYSVTQQEIDALIARDLPNVKIPWKVSYNPRLRYPGTTKYEEVFPGYNRVLEIEIGPQKNASDSELRDSILHEILEARIISRAGLLYKGGDTLIHPYIDRVIAKYVKMKGLQ